MRTINTVKNILFSSGSLVITQLLNFVSRTIFIEVLGVQYLGINALFANILMILSLAELGVGQAITYSLYKPLAENDTIKVNALMALYKSVYRYIGFGVIILSLILLPFIPTLTASAPNVENIYLIFILFVLNSAIGYFWAYKRTLIIADQKAYKLVPFTTVSQLLDISIRIVVLIFTQNYLLFLLTQIAARLIENIVINKYINKQYQHLSQVAQQLSVADKSVIIKNVKAMLLHKIGDVSINGTDSIILSIFVGVTAVGIYSNYLLVIMSVQMFLLLVFNGAGASLGNFIAKESDHKKEEIFRTLNFLAFWLFSWASITLYYLLSPFIELWIGKEFLIPTDVLAVVCINFYLVGMRVPLSVVKSAGGVYTQDKYSPLIQAAINLGASLILVQYWGLLGVFLGTLISSILVPQWNRPYIVYKYLFRQSSKNYFIRFTIYSAAVLLIGFVLNNVFHSMILSVTWLTLIVRFVICFIIPNFLLFIMFRNTSEYKHLKSIITPFFRKVSSWKN
jgi:O-antigen/teichoic acid export membrane protein